MSMSMRTPASYRRADRTRQRAPLSPVQAIARIVAMTGCAASVALVASCCSAPQPSTVDESVRRPVNSPGAIELQRCRAELSQVQAGLVEAAHAATRAAAMAQGAMQQQALRNAHPMACALTSGARGANTVYVVPFGNGSAQWQPDADSALRLAQAAKVAELVVVRGRTDGAVDSAAENQLARRRALAAAAWLQAQGVAPDRLRVQWHAGAAPASRWPADAPADRAGLRRAEIELYGAAPQVIALTAGPATVTSPATRGMASRAAAAVVTTAEASTTLPRQPGD